MCGIILQRLFLIPLLAALVSSSVHALAPPPASSSSASSQPHRHHQDRRPSALLLLLRRRRLSSSSSSSWTQQLATGYERRVAADPSFAVKSVTEVVLAASTQLVAEYKNRGGAGASMLVHQADFVVPAVLTAVAGKYLSLWKTAPTTAVAKGATSEMEQQQQQPHFLGHPVPTNAFQRTLLDGRTVPTLAQRLGSLAAPVGPLFRAGCAASLVGYGLASLGILVRAWLWPSHVPATQPVSVLAATLYTGCFMAVVSNLRYQLLQGVVEPAIDGVFAKIPVVRAALVFAVKVGNGILGSSLAIAGMQLCGLQKMK